MRGPNLYLYENTWKIFRKNTTAIFSVLFRLCHSAGMLHYLFRDMSEKIKFLEYRIESLENELANIRNENEFKDEEIKKIMKAILDNHELTIGITDKVNGAIIDRLKKLLSNENS